MQKVCRTTLKISVNGCVRQLAHCAARKGRVRTIQAGITSCGVFVVHTRLTHVCRYGCSEVLCCGLCGRLSDCQPYPRSLCGMRADRWAYAGLTTDLQHGLGYPKFATTTTIPTLASQVLRVSNPSRPNLSSYLSSEHVQAHLQRQDAGGCAPVPHGSDAVVP